MLFVVLLSGLFAAFLQVLATRLGCVTGLDLASHCRILFYDRPKHPLFYRRLVLYPLYILSEVAIISTDLAELLGSAIALCLLFPKLQLWQAVLITAFDVVLLLALRDPLRSTPVRMFEMLIAGLVLAVLICVVILISKVDVDWGKAFKGYIQRRWHLHIFVSNLYALFAWPNVFRIAVGILGATVMPHALFLGSALATQDRETPPPVVKLKPLQATESQGTTWRRIKKSVASLFRAPLPSSGLTRAEHHADRGNNSLDFIRAHLSHAIVDIVGSLLSFAVLINSLILILAGTVFFYGKHYVSSTASLFDAYDLIHNIFGAPAATTFAIALMASGQSSSIIATVAGQAVSEGFLNWRVSAVTRRLLTRLIAVIPSMAFAIAVGRPGINALLVASQVVLAIVLPFITLPLIYLTSSKTVMRTDNPWDGMIDYSNGTATAVVAYGIWLVMLVANSYVIVTLIMGAH
ncbi:NRAMP family [Mycena metata]|uniref:NRAMP family n=1 Tax=Mycena metata TaxID=1033252 RepID=A0AAD7H6X1_9AGAR|nr:NRAMP family [Mycena metata]